MSYIELRDILLDKLEVISQEDELSLLLASAIQEYSSDNKKSDEFNVLYEKALRRISE